MMTTTMTAAAAVAVAAATAVTAPMAAFYNERLHIVDVKRARARPDHYTRYKIQNINSLIRVSSVGFFHCVSFDVILVDSMLSHLQYFSTLKTN